MVEQILQRNNFKFVVGINSMETAICCDLLIELPFLYAFRDIIAKCMERNENCACVK